MLTGPLSLAWDLGSLVIKSVQVYLVVEVGGDLYLFEIPTHLTVRKHLLVGDYSYVSCVSR